MIAKYDGKCPNCGHVIVGGRDEIDREVSDIEAYSMHGPVVIRTHYGPWHHAHCPEECATGTCPECFLQRPCPCEDEQ